MGRLPQSRKKRGNGHRGSEKQGGWWQRHPRVAERESVPLVGPARGGGSTGPLRASDGLELHAIVRTRGFAPEVEVATAGGDTVCLDLSGKPPHAARGARGDLEARYIFQPELEVRRAFHSRRARTSVARGRVTGTTTWRTCTTPTARVRGRARGRGGVGPRRSRMPCAPDGVGPTAEVERTVTVDVAGRHPVHAGAGLARTARPSDGLRPLIEAYRSWIAGRRAEIA